MNMSKKIKQLFAPKSPLYPLILGLGSLMAVLISLFTLQEMKTQRELSLTPMVFVQDFNDKLIIADTLCKQNYFSNNIVIKNMEDKSEGDLKEWWYIDFINVGEGSAIDINATWKMNYEFFETFFLKNNEIDKGKFNVELGKMFYGYSYNNCEGSNANRKTVSDHHHFSHLLSASNNMDELRVPINRDILKFHIACFRAVWDKQGQNRDNTNLISVNHQLNLTYNSVNGNKFSKKYDVEIQLGPNNVMLNKDATAVTSWKEFYLEVNMEQVE